MKNYICIDGVKTKISCETAENFKEQFDKKEKVELRHGDYGYDEDGGCLLIESSKPVNSNCQFIARDEREELCGSIIGGKHISRKFAPIGNIFDDLKHNAKNLREFEVSGLYDGVDGKTFRCNYNPTNGELWMIIQSSSSYFPLDKAQEIQQKLGQVIATAKRHQKDFSSIKSK